MHPRRQLHCNNYMRSRDARIVSNTRPHHTRCNAEKATATRVGESITLHSLFPVDKEKLHGIREAQVKRTGKKELFQAFAKDTNNKPPSTVQETLTNQAGPRGGDKGHAFFQLAAAQVFFAGWGVHQLLAAKRACPCRRYCFLQP
jgi:hypothetical protein